MVVREFLFFIHSTLREGGGDANRPALGLGLSHLVKTRVEAEGREDVLRLSGLKEGIRNTETFFVREQLFPELRSNRPWMNVEHQK